MKFILLLLMLGVLITSQGQEKPAIHEQANATSVSNLISAYASNPDDISKLYDKSQAQVRSNIIAYYQSRKTQLLPKEKIVVAGCLGEEDDFVTAAKLMEEYVQVYTNNARGWMMLGTASVMTDKKERAIEAYEKCIALGEKGVVTALAGIALQVNRTDIVKKYIPDILRIKNAPSFPIRVRQDAVGILALYAVKVEDQPVFLQAVEGVTVRELGNRKDILKVMDQACQKFSSPKAKEFCQQLAELKQNSK